MNTTVTLVEMECGSCGIPFAMPEVLYDEAHKNKGKNWYCPNGHSRVFRDTFEEKYQRERERGARLLAERDQLEASNRGLRGVVTRKTRELKRVSAGVCPCCNRSFQNLARHMAGQHPEFKPGGQA